MTDFKPPVAIFLVAIALILAGCEKESEEASSADDHTATQPVSADTIAHAQLSIPREEKTNPYRVTLDECKVLHSAATSIAIDAAKLGCEDTSEFPGILAGHECIREARYKTCLSKFSNVELSSKVAN